MIEDAFNDFAINEGHQLDDRPEHMRPIVPKTYKVTTLQHKHNEPVTKTESTNNPRDSL